ncbi:MAG: nonstructural protein [Microviridae sp.]|nr:MAG: nonstructural protein [Microviridae sp.]
MKMKMFSVFDIKAEAFMVPWFMPAQGQAVRAFSDLVEDRNSMVGKHPGDYKLVYIGEFDDSNGEFFPGGLISLGFGTDYVPKAEVMALHKGTA